MTARRSALGRGLGALIPSSPSSAAATAPVEDASPAPVQEPARTDESRTGPAQIPVSSIDPNPEQPRRVFDPAQLASLVESLQRHGVLQPVVVRRAGERFELIVGERRWRAAKAAGLDTVPAVVADIDPQDRLELAIVENVQRHDLNPIELAHAYSALRDSGHTQDEIGERVGLDRSSVANHLRLLDLPRDVQEDVEAGRITMGHAKALLQIANPERLRHLRDEVIRDALSVRDTERRGRSIAGPAPPRTPRQKPAAATDPDMAQLVDGLRDHLQTKVRIAGDGKKGRIEIDYFSLEELDRLARLILDGPGSLG